MSGNLRVFKVRLGSAQDPIKGTSTLDNPNASRCAPALNLSCTEYYTQFILNPVAWSRVLPDRRIKSLCLYGSILQGQSPI